MLESLFLLNTGYCQHPEFTVIQGGRFGLAAFPATVVVMVHKKLGVTLFDAGYAQRFHSATSRGIARIYAMTTPVTHAPGEAACEQLARMGIAADDVRTVILSHFHADHIAGVRDFPKAQLVYKDEGWKALSGLGAVARLRRGFLPDLLPTDFRQRSRPLTAADSKPNLLPYGDFSHGYDLCGDGSVVAVDLPGHAAGHIGLVAQYGGESYFFVSDAAWAARSITEYRPPSGLAKLIMDDPVAFDRTLRRLHGFHQAHPEVKILPCHCASTLRQVPAAPVTLKTSAES